MSNGLLKLALKVTRRSICLTLPATRYTRGVIASISWCRAVWLGAAIMVVSDARFESVSYWRVICFTIQPVHGCYVAQQGSPNFNRIQE